MNAYRWTVRVALGGVALLALSALFVAVARIFDLVIAGVYPEAWVLQAISLLRPGEYPEHRIHTIAQVRRRR